MVAKQELRMPLAEEITVGQIPGNVLARIEQDRENTTYYYSKDGRYRLKDDLFVPKNERQLALEVSVTGDNNWFTVMEVRETLSPKGAKVLSQHLLVESIDPTTGKSSMYFYDDHGKRKPFGMYSSQSPEDAMELIRLGVYIESQLPSRIDRAATMENFFNVVRSGRMTRPQIV